MNKQTLRWALASVAVVAVIGAAATYNFIGKAEATEAKAPAAAAEKSLKDIIKDDMVYASFDDQKVTGKDVRAVVDQLPPQLQAAPADKVLTLLVNQLVNDRLVDKAATTEKLVEDAVVKDRLALATKQIMRERYLEKQLDGKINDAAIKAKYDELVKSMPPTDEVRASHILVGDEAKAKEVMAKLTKGEDFAALAKQYSIDPSKDQGGDLGYFVKNAMVKEFGEAAFAMNKGDVSKTPVKTQFGYHIIKVVDKRKQQPPELDKVKDAIRGRITEEKVRDIVDGLRGKAKIDFNLPGQAPEKK